MKKEAQEILLAKAFFYVSIRIRSKHEMLQYLKKKAALIHGTEEDVEQVISRLKELKYINDESFVESYVRSRNASKQKGEYVIRLELKRKGISETIIDHFFQLNIQDPVELAKNAIRTRWSGYTSFDPMKRKKRAQDFLLRRGFSYDTIREVLEWAHNNL